MRTEPPQHLSEKAKEWWRKLSSEYPLDDSAAKILLAAALTAFDRANEARVILKRDGLVIEDDKGKIRAHPMCLVETNATKTMLAALHGLNLDLEPLSRDLAGKPRPGRRPGDRSHAYSQTPPNTLPQ